MVSVESYFIDEECGRLRLNLKLRHLPLKISIGIPERKRLFLNRKFKSEIKISNHNSSISFEDTLLFDMKKNIIFSKLMVLRLPPNFSSKEILIRKPG
jgi:hypothetical protein